MIYYSCKRLWYQKKSKDSCDFCKSLDIAFGPNFYVEYIALATFICIYRIRLIATPGFYFSKWVFGWGLIQKILQKVDFLTKKWGFIQEKPQKQDFSISWGCNQADTVINCIDVGYVCFLLIITTTICLYTIFTKQQRLLWVYFTLDDYKKDFENGLITNFCHVSHLNTVLDHNPTYERPNLKDVLEEYNSIPFDKLAQKRSDIFVLHCLPSDLKSRFFIR